MRTSQQWRVTLPKEMAEAVKAKVAAGEDIAAAAAPPG